MKTNCFNCQHKTKKSECAIKSSLARGFSSSGSKYNKGVSISFEDEHDCKYFKPSANVQKAIK